VVTDRLAKVWYMGFAAVSPSDEQNWSIYHQCQF